MTERTVDVTSDTWVDADHPSRPHGDDEGLRLNSGVQRAFLWWRQPWDREATVLVSQQLLRLTAKGASTGARTLTAQGTSKRFDAEAIDWDDQPGVTGATCTQAIGTLADGDTVDVDITAYATAVAAGAKNAGIRLITSAGTSHRFYSADSPYPPQIITTWTETPDAPSIKPAGGIIGVPKPVVGLDYDEDDGDLTGVRVQVDAVGDASIDFDSGSVGSTVAQLDLSSTAFGGFTAGASKFVRGTVTVGGVESGLADWVSWLYQPKHTVVIDSPSLGVVTSPTPVILAHVVPGFVGETLSKYRAQIYDAARTTLLYDTLEQPATDPADIAVDVPATWKGRRVLTEVGGVGYSLKLHAWGDEERVSTIGVPDYAEAWADFVVNSGAVAAPTGLTVTPIDGQPGLQVDFTITPDAPDSIVIAADDKVVATLEPEDAFVSGTSYSWLYVGAAPWRSVDIKVAKVVDGVMSPWAGPVAGTAEPAAVWLVDAARGLNVQLWGVDVEQWRFTDQGAEYDPEGSPCFVHVITSQRGTSGEFVGKVRDVPELTHEEQIAAVWAMKERPKREVQLVTGLWSIPVRLKDLSAGPSRDHRSVAHTSVVRFRFDQSGDLPFTSRFD